MAKEKKILFGGAAIYLNQFRKAPKGYYYKFGGHCFGVPYEWLFEVQASDLVTAYQIANEIASNECSVQFKRKSPKKKPK